MFILAGCASPSSAVLKTRPASIGKLVSLDFILVQSSGSLAEVESEKHLLNDLIISGLKETQLFETVSGAKPDGNPTNGIEVMAEIKEIHKVTDDARLWYGALAGQARIVVEVKVSDLGSGDPVVTFVVEGKSGKSAKAGTTAEAVQSAAGRIVSEVVKLNAQSIQ